MRMPVSACAMASVRATKVALLMFGLAYWPRRVQLRDAQASSIVPQSSVLLVETFGSRLHHLFSYPFKESTPRLASHYGISDQKSTELQFRDQRYSTKFRPRWLPTVS